MLLCTDTKLPNATVYYILVRDKLLTTNTDKFISVSPSTSDRCHVILVGLVSNS